MIKILQIIDSLSEYGTEAFIMNVLNHINRDEIMFDFLVSRKTGSRFEKEAIALGSRIFTYASRKEGWRKHIKSLHDFFRENAGSYKAVHAHGNSFTAMMPLAIACKYGIPIRIAHCHNSSTSGVHNKLLHRLNKTRIHKIANRYFACSELVRAYGFKGTPAYEKSIVVPNGIELGRFRYNASIRKAKRQELGLGEELVIGNVAAFREAKNHRFMVEIMKEVVKLQPDAKLLLAGDGILLVEIEEAVNRAKLGDNVMFLGKRDDIPELLQAMDIFLFPSFYEGLGISVIEAEAAGLPVIASTGVPTETKITPLIRYIPLTRPAREWAEEINTIQLTDRSADYPDLLKFDIQNTCKILQGIYAG